MGINKLGENMENQSYWQKTVKLNSYPQITKAANYDVVIIGGGMSGITLAYRLNNSGLKVALLEANTLASQTTGHTTGKVTYLHGAIYSELAKAYNINKAKQYLESNYEAFCEIKKIIDEKQIDCDYQENISYIGANDEKNSEKIIEQIAMLKKWGFNVLENELEGYQASMGLNNQAIFHPLKYLAGLLQFCNNIEIYEHSLVRDSFIEDNLVNLKVNNLIIKTKKAIWMTRYPINLQHGYFIRLLQEREHISYQNIQSNSNSVLDLTTNYSKRLVDNQHCLVIDQLAKKTWYGQDTKALRKLPYIGKINDYEYISYGYDKWGMTLSHVASKIIYDLIVYQDSKYASLYAIGNGNYLHAGSDIVKLIKNNYHGMIKNRIFVAKDVKLKAGEGKVVRHRGRLLAIYRDFDDRVFYMSPYCPHLKCVVEFNLQDQTWCCPCHGSIYNCYGKLLNGPATSSLKKSKPG